VESSESGSPERVDGLTGTVVRGSFGKGSKSEREAIWLEATGRRLVLRRKGGPSFDDHSLEKYIGKRVKCDGFVVGYTLLAEQIETLR
jgi:hypothetical protein